ncbi:MAG: hypothetical protein PHE33_00735 [Bacteroidales bacterium]|nr:hypothetical protein [Bacteroidales bacterium]
MLIVLLILLSFYLLGSIIGFVFKIGFTSNAYYNTFVRLVIGLLLATSVYAVFVTGGNTILWGFILIGILAFFQNKFFNKSPENKNDFSINHKFKNNVVPLLSLIVLACIFYFIQSSLFYTNSFSNIPQGDYYYYSKLIYALNTFGVESSIYVDNPFNKGVAGASFYHYPELWLASLISSIFSILPLDSIVVHTHTILLSILAMGMLALSRTICNSVFIDLLGLISMYFAGIVFIEIIPQTKPFIDFGNAYTSKYIIISIFYLWFTILALNKSKYLFYPLLILPIINTALAPTIFISIIIFIALKIIIGKQIRKYLHYLVPTLIVAIFILMFYSLQHTSTTTRGVDFNGIIQIHKSLPFKCLKIAIGAVLIILLTYIWYFIPVFLFNHKKWKQKPLEILKSGNPLLLYFVIVFFVSIGFWSILHPMPDSIQFYYLSTYFLLNIIIFILWAKTYKSLKSESALKRFAFWIICLVLITLNFTQINDRAFFRYRKITNAHSEKYILNISTKLKENTDNPVGAYLAAKTEINNVFQANACWVQRPYIDNFIASFNMVNLSTSDYSVSKDDIILKYRTKEILKNAPFEMFSVNYQTINGVTSSDSLKYIYIHNNNIKYLVVHPRASIPSVLNEMIDTIYTDTKSGQQFIWLK